MVIQWQLTNKKNPKKKHKKNNPYNHKNQPAKSRKQYNEGKCDIRVLWKFLGTIYFVSNNLSGNWKFLLFILLMRYFSML